jgi:hypothetical protein
LKGKLFPSELGLKLTAVIYLSRKKRFARYKDDVTTVLLRLILAINLQDKNPSEEYLLLNKIFLGF